MSKTVSYAQWSLEPYCIGLKLRSLRTGKRSEFPLIAFGCRNGTLHCAAIEARNRPHDLNAANAGHYRPGLRGGAQ